MKTHLSILTCLLALALLAPLRAADDTLLNKLSKADDQRVAALLAGDTKALGKTLSDDLIYTHSSGAVDTKSSLTELLDSGRTKYTGFSYEERNFTFPAPTIALMTGKVRLKATTPKGAVDTLMSFLGVWREEKGEWHFLAWQSCKLPPATPEPAAAK